MTKDNTNAGGKSLWLDHDTWRGALLRREVVSICLFVFTADMILGSMRPILSLFAQSLGASLTLVGALSLVVGITQLSSGVVIGAISDRQGRKGVLMIGMLFLALTSLLFALTTVPYLLLPVQVLLGLGFVSTITVTVAYAADVAGAQERSLVIGLVTTMMGLGYATGSLVGGTVAELWGYSATYRMSVVLSVTGFLIGWRGIPARRYGTRPEVQSELSIRQQVGVLLVDPIILAVSIGGLLIFLAFGGMVVAFFPIYAHSVGITQATIGSMFAARALASTLVRLPGSALATILPDHRIMLMAMLLTMTVAFVVPQINQPVMLTFCLIGEGIAYGVFLTISQATIAGRVSESSRGAALGVYSTATGIGGSVLPFFLGLAADAFGIKSVFYIVGGLVALGVGVMARASTERQ